MFDEEKTVWDREMLIQEAIRSAESGFTVQLKNGARINVAADSPCLDLLIFGLEKTVRGAHQRNRKTFIDFLYYWHERLFNRVKKR
jgi:hypothetical protein